MRDTTADVISMISAVGKVTEWRSPPGDRPSVSKTSRSLQRGCTFFFFFFFAVGKIILPYKP